MNGKLEKAGTSCLASLAARRRTPFRAANLTWKARHRRTSLNLEKLEQRTLLSADFGGGQIEWAKAALACGYSDQSHMIRDFRAFSGVTPRAYQPVEPARRNHLAVTGSNPG